MYFVDPKKMESDSLETDLMQAYNADDLQKFQKLWGYDADGNEVENDDGWYIDDANFLVKATRKREGEKFEEQISMTIVSLATIDGKVEFLKSILYHPDTDFNVRDEKGVNAFWYAVKRQNYEITELLLNFR